MIELFRIDSAQNRGLNFHTKSAATTACDTFPLFPRTVSFSTAHGLREGVANPKNLYFLHLWIASCHISHSSLMALVTPPCTAQLHVPSDVFHGGVPVLDNSISLSPEFQGHGLGVCLHTHSETPPLQPKSSGSMQKRKDIMRQSPSGRGAGAEQEGETTGQAAVEGKEEEWDHRNSNNNSESHLETTAGNWVQAQAWAGLPKPRPFIIQCFQMWRIWDNASSGRSCKPPRWLIHGAEIKLLLIIFLAIWWQQGSAGCRLLTLLRGWNPTAPWH